LSCLNLDLIDLGGDARLGAFAVGHEHAHDAEDRAAADATLLGIGLLRLSNTPGRIGS
jgi:hypothetical protein